MALGGFAPLPLRLGGTPEGGITPEQWLRICADVAAARRTAPFAYLVIDQNNLDPKILEFRSQFGVGVNDRPKIAYANARTTLTFPSTIEDEAGMIGRVVLNCARGALHNSPLGGKVLVNPITVRNQISVAPINRAGSVLGSAVFSLLVR